MTTPTNPAASPHAEETDRRANAVLLTMCFGVLLAQLDSSVVFIGLKHIGGDLDASISEMQWVLDSYNLVYATFLLTGGALGDLYGRLRLFACGVALIVAGSLACALAQDGAMLIAALAIAGLMTFGMYSMLFLMPLYFQSVAGASAFVAGLELLPISIAFVAVSQRSGALMHRFGARAMLAGGMGFMGTGLLALTQISATTPMALVQLALIVVGVGLGLNTGPVNAVAVAAVPAARSGTASGLLNTARMAGATTGIALLGAIYAAHAQEGGAQAMLDGLHRAFLGGAIGELSGAAITLIFIRADSMVRKPA